MTALEKLQAAPREVRNAALTLLDAVSRPLTARELDDALRDEGITRSQRRAIIRALKHVSIIVLRRTTGS